MADQQILVAGTSAIPLTYTVPNAVEAALLCVNANVDGSAATGSFLAAVEIVSDGGIVVARCPCFTTIAAGGSAEISWFRLRETTTEATTASTYTALVTSTPLLRAYYKLDETSGTTMRDSGPVGMHGTYHNTPTLGVPPLADGTAVTFLSASLQYGEAFATAGFNAHGPQAVAAWIKASVAPATFGTICSCDDNGFRYLQLRVKPSGQVDYIVFDVLNNLNDSVTSPGSVLDGARHFIHGTWTAGQVLTLFVDNVAVASKTTALAGQSASIHTIDIGARTAGPTTAYFDGTIDEVAIYNGVPSTSYFTSIYNLGLTA